MAFMEWSDEFSVGVREIDEQHKRLIEMLCTFYDSVRKNHQEAFEYLLEEMARYVVYHFSTEERYMKQFGFEGMEEHVREHRAFTNKVGDVQKRIAAGQLVVSLEITGFLRSWIRNHVLGTDKQYTECFRANGLS